MKRKRILALVMAAVFTMTGVGESAVFAAEFSDQEVFEEITESEEADVIEAEESVADDVAVFESEQETETPDSEVVEFEEIIEETPIAEEQTGDVVMNAPAEDFAEGETALFDDGTSDVLFTDETSDIYEGYLETDYLFFAGDDDVPLDDHGEFYVKNSVYPDGEWLTGYIHDDIRIVEESSEGNVSWEHDTDRESFLISMSEAGTATLELTFNFEDEEFSCKQQITFKAVDVIYGCSQRVEQLGVLEPDMLLEGRETLISTSLCAYRLDDEEDIFDYTVKWTHNGGEDVHLEVDEEDSTYAYILVDSDPDYSDFTVTANFYSADGTEFLISCSSNYNVIDAMYVITLEDENGDRFSADILEVNESMVIYPVITEYSAATGDDGAVVDNSGFTFSVRNWDSQVVSILDEAGNVPDGEVYITVQPLTITRLSEGYSELVIDVYRNDTDTEESRWACGAWYEIDDFTYKVVTKSDSMDEYDELNYIMSSEETAEFSLKYPSSCELKTSVYAKINGNYEILENPENNGITLSADKVVVDPSALTIEKDLILHFEFELYQGDEVKCTKDTYVTIIKPSVEYLPYYAEGEIISGLVGETATIYSGSIVIRDKDFPDESWFDWNCDSCEIISGDDVIDVYKDSDGYYKIKYLKPGTAKIECKYKLYEKDEFVTYNYTVKAVNERYYFWDCSPYNADGEYQSVYYPGQSATFLPGIQVQGTDGERRRIDSDGYVIKYKVNTSESQNPQNFEITGLDTWTPKATVKATASAGDSLLLKGTLYKKLDNGELEYACEGPIMSYFGMYVEDQKTYDLKLTGNDGKILSYDNSVTEMKVGDSLQIHKELMEHSPANPEGKAVDLVPGTATWKISVNSDFLEYFKITDAAGNDFTLQDIDDENELVQNCDTDFILTMVKELPADLEQVIEFFFAVQYGEITTNRSVRVDCSKCTHNYRLLATIQEPSCDSEGVGEYVCDNKKCNRVIVVKEIPKTGHSWKTTTTPATCTADGKSVNVCENCTLTGETKVLPKTGHTWSAWKTTSNAVKFSNGNIIIGEQQRSCSGCKSIESKPLKQHQATIKLSSKAFKMKKGQTMNTFTVTMAEGDYVTSIKPVKSTVVSVTKWNKDGTCTLKAKKTGSTDITVTLASGKTAKAKVTVKTDVITTKKIKDVPKTATVNVKKSITLDPTITPFNSSQKVTYKSSNNKIAKVSSTGKITGVAPGKATITVTSGSKTAKCTVTVPGIKVSKSSVTLKKGQTAKLTVNKYGISGKVTYTSKKPSVATVNAKGKITAKKKGKTTITIKAGSFKKTCKVTVK